MLPKVCEISCGVGATNFSGTVEKPAAIRSCIRPRRIGGTLSSVARIVKRTIYAPVSGLPFRILVIPMPFLP
jgi:hypothetical protein